MAGLVIHAAAPFVGCRSDDVMTPRQKRTDARTGMVRKCGDAGSSASKCIVFNLTLQVELGSRVQAKPQLEEQELDLDTLYGSQYMGSHLIVVLTVRYSS